MDVTVCDQFPDSAERLECIKALVDLAKIANETDDEEVGFLEVPSV